MDDTLIERLEAASEGSRELDTEVFKAIGAPVPFQFMNKLLALEFNDVEQAYFARVSDDMQVRYSPPTYTASLDAAMTLMPEGWEVGLRTYVDHPALVQMFAPEGARGGGEVTHAATPALALCIAALRAQAGEKS